MDLVLKLWVSGRLLIAAGRDRLREEAGEGVISTAIVVLIMALIGLAMWQVFDRVFTDAGTEIERNVNQIG